MAMPAKDSEASSDDGTEAKRLLNSGSPAAATRGGGGGMSNALTLVYCLLYLLVGPWLIIVNKTIMRDYGFNYPMIVSGLGQASSALGSLVAIRVLRVQELECQEQVTWSFYLRNMAVVGAATAASLSFGNAGYLYLTVSFVQILKAFTPVVVVLMLYLTAVEIPSKRVAFSVLMIAAGTAIASAGEVNFSVMGIAIMAAAETSEATRLVLTQKLLTNLKFPALEGLYYMAPICTFWMWGVASFTELPRAYASGGLAIAQAHAPTFALAALLGFLVNIASFVVIKRTNSLMLKLMGTARNAGLVLFSATFLGDTIMPTQVLGYAVCLAFFGVYNYFKMNKL